MPLPLWPPSMPSSRAVRSSARGRLIAEVVAFAVVLALVVFFTHRARGPQGYEEHRVAMGTLVSVTVFGGDEEAARAAIEIACERMARVERLTTRYSSESEIERLNARGSGKVEPDVARVLSTALEVAGVTGGAFDPTVAPLVELWEFDADMVLPNHSDVLRALARVGFSSVRLDTLACRVDLGGATIDLDGIAKGFAVDRAVLALESMGVESAIVDAGGDIRLLGRAPRGREWRVGVKHPRAEGLLGVLRVRGGSVATSGDYQRCGFVDGVRYHHILNPRTGYPARGVVSVTVVCDRCADADALATAVFVMGATDGLAFVESRPGVECVIACGDEDVEEVFVSSGLEGKFEESR